MCQFLLTCSILLHASVVSLLSLIFWTGDKYIGIYQSLNLRGIWHSKHCWYLLVCQNSPFLCPSNLCFVQHARETPCKVYLIWSVSRARWGMKVPLAVVLGQWLVELEGKYLQLSISLRHNLHRLPGLLNRIGVPAANSCHLFRNIPFIGQLLSLFHFPTSLLVFLNMIFQIKHLFARFSRYGMFLNFKKQPFVNNKGHWPKL